MARSRSAFRNTPATAASRIRQVPRLAAALAALGFTACTAPGMKLDVQASARPTTAEMGGLQVTLRRLDPHAVAVQAPVEDFSGLAALMEDHPAPYLIGPQDVLMVTVWDHPEITQVLGPYRSDSATGSLVEDDGTLYFPYVGKLMVKGLTLSQVRTLLTADLARVLKNPQVDVKVLAFRSQKVYVGGEVKNPATYDVTDVPFTLSEAVNRAGGFLPDADDSRMVLTRGDRSWVLDFQALMSRSSAGGKIYLKDGDTLLVPTNLENPVYVLGEVARPGTLPLIHGDISLAKALSDAGGIQGASSDARSIYVIRKGAKAAAVDVFHLDARNPVAMVLADQFALKPRDIVYVDAGTAVRFSRVMDLLLPTVDAVVSGTTSVYEIKYFKRN